MLISWANHSHFLFLFIRLFILFLLMLSIMLFSKCLVIKIVNGVNMVIGLKSQVDLRNDLKFTPYIIKCKIWQVIFAWKIYCLLSLPKQILVRYLPHFLLFIWLFRNCMAFISKLGWNVNYGWRAKIYFVDYWVM